MTINPNMSFQAELRLHFLLYSSPHLPFTEVGVSVTTLSSPGNWAPEKSLNWHCPPSHLIQGCPLTSSVSLPIVFLVTWAVELIFPPRTSGKVAYVHLNDSVWLGHCISRNLSSAFRNAQTYSLLSRDIHCSICKNLKPSKLPLLG